MLIAARRIFIASVVLSATLHSSVARATWPSNPAVNLPVCTAEGDQDNPTMMSDGAGVIVTWNDNRNGNAAIYAQRVSAAGTPSWTANGVALCTATSDQWVPTIVSDGAGGAIVTWFDYRNGSANADIYAQRVNVAGVPQWAADGVALCTAASVQDLPQITSDGAGGAIVTWEDYRSAYFHIYAQRVNAAGVPQWTTDGVAICTAATSQFSPRIVSDGAGGAIVTWGDYRGPTPTLADIYSQRVNAAGVPQWTANGVALCSAVGNQVAPVLVSDGGSGAIIAWDDYRNGDFPDIYAQCENPAGATHWTANGVALCTAPYDQSAPTITSDGAGGAIVAWHDNRVPPFLYSDIYAQRVNVDGVAKWGANGVALCTAADVQQYPAIASDGMGGAIVTWYDRRSGTNNDIYAQRVDEGGTPQWTADGVAISIAANDQYNPAIVSAGAGGAIITWISFRHTSANLDIFAQNVNANGTLGGTVLSVPPLSIATSFALRSVQPNPSLGELRVTFSLSDGTPASLELYDLTGRRIESQSVGNLGPGAHIASLTSRVASLPPGIYCVSLTQGSHRAFSKVAIVR